MAAPTGAWRFFWISACLALAVGGTMAACGDSGSSGGPAAADSARLAAAQAAEPPPIHGDTVEVILDEYVIDMPDTIPAGHTVFHLRNAGFESHNFEIRRGDSTLYELDWEMNPSSQRSVEIELPAGSYRVLCTESGHDSKGMSNPLVVSGPEPGSEPE